MVGSLPSFSVVLPPLPASDASLSSLNGLLQVLLQLCLTTICGQIDRMFIFKET